MSFDKALNVFIKGYKYSKNQATGTDFLDSMVEFLSDGNDNNINHSQSSQCIRRSGNKSKITDFKDEEAPQGTPNDLICKICVKNKRNILFLPCTHTVCCIKCTTEIKKNNHNLCPICRESIGEAVHYYRS